MSHPSETPDIPPHARGTLLFCVVALGFAQTVLFAILAPLGREIGLPEIQIGAIISASSLTMFIASPILNRSQEVIAVLAERYNPHETFSEILKLGRLGRSGETYAFNSDAYLVSGSRFDTDLISQGFLLNTEQSILSVRVVEPSANGELSSSTCCYFAFSCLLTLYQQGNVL